MGRNEPQRVNGTIALQLIEARRAIQQASLRKRWGERP